MDNLTTFSFFNKVIGIAHWIFYSVFVVGIILNAETWIFGLKFSGQPAQVAVLGMGFCGLIIGGLIYTQKKKAYFGAIALIIFITANAIFGYFSS